MVTEINFKNDIEKWLKNQVELKPESTGIKPRLATGSSSPVKAVIFDIYGTLLVSSSGDIESTYFSEENILKALEAGGFDPEKIHTDAFQFIFQQLPKKIRDHHTELKTQGHVFPDIDIIRIWQEIIEEAEKKQLLEVSGDESYTDLVIVFEILSNQVYTMPGMVEILKWLNRQNIPLGVVSNAQFYTPVIMNYFMSGSLIKKMEIEGFDPDLTVFSFTELRAKPDVFLFQKIVPKLKEKYNILPSEALFVGNDMVKDIYTAHKAGLKTALFAGDKRSLRLRENDGRIKNIEPDYVITELEQLKQIVT